MSALPTVIGDYWGFHHGDMGFGWWLIMFLINVIFWAAVVYGIVRLVRGGWHRAASGASAREILDRRLASGEITPDEHDRLASRLNDSTRDRTSPPPAPSGGQTASG